MSKYWTTVLSVVVGSLWLVSAAAGDEPQVDKLRGRADEMMRDVQQLHEQGKHEEAQRLEREVAELREKAERIARDGDQQPGPGEVIANRLRELSQQWGNRQRGPDEATTNRLRELSQQWIDAMASEQRDVAERLQQEIHDIARDTGARVQEIMKPQLEMIDRKIAELREQGHPDAAERLATQLRNAAGTSAGLGRTECAGDEKTDRRTASARQTGPGGPPGKRTRSNA